MARKGRKLGDKGVGLCGDCLGGDGLLGETTSEASSLGIMIMILCENWGGAFPE